VITFFEIAKSRYRRVPRRRITIG
jgi:hypothetical protein